jgi:hypothetical protein
MKRKFNHETSSQTTNAIWKPEYVVPDAIDSASIREDKGRCTVPRRVDFKEYMQDKNQKLRMQFLDKTQASNSHQKSSQTQPTHGSSFTEPIPNNQPRRDQGSQIFGGVTIWVNGYTLPTSLELKALMATYGGVYEHYYSKSKVTDKVPV